MGTVRVAAWVGMWVWAMAAGGTVAWGQGEKLPQAVESDARLHADGKGWRLDKAKIDDPQRPRVLLIGDSILNGYLKRTTAGLEGRAYVDAWVNPYCQSKHLNKLLGEVLEQGPYDVVHFNMGLHGWQEGRIKPEEFSPLTKAYVEVIRTKLPQCKIIWASTTPVTVKQKPTELEPKINPVVVEHNRLAAEVMAEMKVPVNDFYTLLVDQLPLARGDQFHWKPEAYEQLAQATVKAVLNALPAEQKGNPPAEGTKDARKSAETSAQSETKSSAPAYNDPQPKKYDLTARASKIDPRAKEHPEIGFVFGDGKGKQTDVQHAAVDTRVAPQGKLVVWLMGHNQGLFDRTASYGLHAVQVHYANGWFGKVGKDALNDGVSLGKIRLEAATGEDHSPLVDIPQPDGMMERTRQFLLWLAKEHPQGKWDQFLSTDGRSVRWDKVIMSGISHGATTSARFAVHQRVDRVVVFSGPRDQLESWHGFPSATPSNRFFGFTHVLDGGWTGDHYCRSWQMLGLHNHGPLVDVEQTPSPYAHSRRLITQTDVKNDPNRAHNMVVPGGNASKTPDGKYLHESVWRYLFNHPVTESGPAVPLDPDCRMDLRR